MSFSSVLTRLFAVALLFASLSLSAEDLEPAALPVITERAAAVLREHQDSIVQVRIINVRSGSRGSHGTGFFIDEGMLATNYHVISRVVLEPDEYKAVITLDGVDLDLEVSAIDVVHDLAIARVSAGRPPLRLSERAPERGTRLYSIGNPHNLGTTVVEGNYNGLVADRFFDEIHYAGAINAGMSGGPTLDDRGQVVGVNYASSGNQIGHLVPVEKLRLLQANLAAVPPGESVVSEDPDAPTHLQRQIGDQVRAATHYMLNELLAGDWPEEPLGPARVIGKIHPAMQCWGNSDQDEDTKINTVNRGCNSGQESRFYLSHQLNTGYVEYEFSYLEGESWPSSGFYRLASDRFGFAWPGNRAGKDDVGNYQCIDRVVSREGNQDRRKLSYCTRPYVLFDDLFDTFYMGVFIDHKDRVLMEHFTLSGVSREDADRFLAQFINRVGWQ